MNIHSINTYWVCTHRQCGNDSDYKWEDRHGSWPPGSHKVNNRVMLSNQRKPNHTPTSTKEEAVIRNGAVHNFEKENSQKLKKKITLTNIPSLSLRVYSISQKLNKVSVQNYLPIITRAMLKVKKNEPSPTLSICKVPHSPCRKPKRLPHNTLQGE